jgi:hypothetical protein
MPGARFGSLTILIYIALNHPRHYDFSQAVGLYSIEHFKSETKFY